MVPVPVWLEMVTDLVPWVHLIGYLVRWLFGFDLSVFLGVVRVTVVTGYEGQHV